MILFNQSFAIQVKNGTPREGGGAIKTWFPRMVDKAQLSYEKKLDKLRLAYPCPNDKQVLSYMGITAETFKEMEKFIAKSAPQFQLATGKSRQSALPTNVQTAFK